MIKKIKFALLFCSLLAMGSCGIFGSSFSRMLSKSDIISKDFKVEESFNFDKRLIVVKAIIKGKEFEFIFDTGASLSILSQDAANVLNLEEENGININDSQGNRQKLGTAIIDTISIGGVKFKGIAVSIIDWPENSAIKCIAKDGIIGNNLIRHCNWIIDYKNSTMIISDQDLSDDDFINVSMKTATKRPRLDIKINEKKLNNVLLDLGSGGGLDISRDLAKKLELNAEKYNGIYFLDGSSQGLFGSKLDSVCTLKIDSLAFGDGALTIQNAALDIESKKGAKIGNVLLATGLLHLDYSNNIIGFKPYKKQSILKDKKSFSFSPSWGDKGLYISSIQKMGLADEMGISYGDIIYSINGKRSQDFQDYCDYFNYMLNDVYKNDSLVLIMDNQKEDPILFNKKSLWEN
tara:strand:+ start:605 stop:1822 length:1218 start_codon:yes stop_codon:yes gene_type:complete